MQTQRGYGNSILFKGLCGTCCLSAFLIGGCKSPSETALEDNPFDAKHVTEALWVRCQASLLELPREVDLTALDGWPGDSASAFTDGQPQNWPANGLVLSPLPAENRTILWQSLMQAGARESTRTIAIVHSPQEVAEFVVGSYDEPVTTFVDDGNGDSPRGLTLEAGECLYRLSLVPRHANESSSQINVHLVPVYRGFDSEQRFQMDHQGRLLQNDSRLFMVFESLFAGTTLSEDTSILIAPEKAGSPAGSLGDLFLHTASQSGEQQKVLLLTPELFKAYRTTRQTWPASPPAEVTEN